MALAFDDAFASWLDLTLETLIFCFDEVSAALEKAQIGFFDLFPLVLLFDCAPETLIVFNGVIIDDQAAEIADVWPEYSYSVRLTRCNCIRLF